MGNSFFSVSLLCWSMGLTSSFAGESTTAKKTWRTAVLFPYKQAKKVQYEQRPCMLCLYMPSVKSTKRVLTGSVRPLQEQEVQIRLVWGDTSQKKETSVGRDNPGFDGVLTTLMPAQSQLQSSRASHYVHTKLLTSCSPQVCAR